MALECPFCGYVWEPRVKSPRCCPRCKRGWTKGRAPKEVAEEVSQEWMHKLPIGGVVDSVEGGYTSCAICIALDDDTEGAYVWMKETYCLRHFIDVVSKFDEAYPYRKSDPVGELATARATYREHLQRSQDLYEDTLPVPALGPKLE